MIRFCYANSQPPNYGELFQRYLQMRSQIVVGDNIYYVSDTEFVKLGYETRLNLMTIEPNKQKRDAFVLKLGEIQPRSMEENGGYVWRDLGPAQYKLLHRHKVGDAKMRHAIQNFLRISRTLREMYYTAKDETNSSKVQGSRRMF